MNKKLYRSRTDKMIAGVCGGLGEYFGVDSTMIRLGVAAAAIIGGFGVYLYIAAAFIIPEKPGDTDGQS